MKSQLTYNASQDLSQNTSNIYGQTGNCQNYVFAQGSGMGTSNSQQLYYPYTQFPNYYQQGLTYQYQTLPIYYLTVRQIENGWIVVKDGKEYLMTEPSDIIEFFQKDSSIKVLP